MKKIISVLLCLGLVFSLCACEIQLDFPSTFFEDNGISVPENLDDIVISNGNESTENGTTTPENKNPSSSPSSTPSATQPGKPSGSSSQSGSSKPSAPAHVHKYSDATCTKPKLCACGDVAGDILGHSYSGGKCSRCGAANPNQITGKTWSQVKASMPSSLRGTKVVFYNWNPLGEYEGMSEAFNELENQTGIKVEWLRVSHAEYLSKLAALIASHEAPDIVRMKQPLPERLKYCQPLSVSGYDFNDTAWDQSVMKDYSVKGAPYATSLNNTHLGTVGMMFYNNKLIKNLGLEDPYLLWKEGKWTTDKFLQMCKDFLKKTDEDAAAVGVTVDKWLQLYGISGNIGFINGVYSSNMNNANLVTVTKQFADYYTIQKIFGQGRAEVFDADRALFYMGPSIFARRKNSYFQNVKSAGNFYAVPMPSVTGQGTYYQSRDEYEAYAISKGAKNPKAVPYVLRYVLDSANYDLERVFCNKQNLEVYNWCMAQESKIWSLPFAEPSSSNGIYKKTGNQVKSYIDSIKYHVDNVVNDYNTAWSNITKQ